MIRETINKFNSYLESWPDKALTILLILIAAFAVYVALTQRPIEKAALAAWLIFP